jgi:hypothetical protein
MAGFITRPDYIPRYELRAGAPRACVGPARHCLAIYLSMAY